jgi:hypothetical protein
MLKKAILLFPILCMLVIMVSCGGNPIIPPVDEEGNIQITDMFWNSNTKIIEITLDPFPSTWGNWTMYIDGEKLPMEGGPGNPVIRPNASLDELPTGLLVGTLPWVSPLTEVDFPCCGTLQFNIPGEGFTNEYEFNLINFGCETASEEECTQTPIPSPEPEADELDYDEVDRFDSITDSDGLSTFNVEEDVKINVKVEDEKTGMPLSDINVDIFLYEGKIAYLIVDPSGDYIPKIIAEEQSYKDYSSQSKFPVISTIVKLIKRTGWAIEGYTSGGAQFSDQIDNKFLKYLFDYIFQYGGKTTLGDLKYSMEDTIITFCDTGLNLAIIPFLTISGPIGWASIAIDAFDMGDTFAVAQWAKKYESLGYSDSDYFEIYYWIPVPYFPLIKIPFYPVIVPIGEPEESSVEPVNGDITNISPLTDSFILDTWYTTYVYVKNTGSVAHTFTVRGVETIGSIALYFKEGEKPISLEAGESDYLSFEYMCYGDSTDDRILIFRLYENADDEPLEYIDQMTKNIVLTESEEPPSATVAPIISIVEGADDGYVNADEVAYGLAVLGNGPAYAEIKIYINDICAYTGEVLADGSWWAVVVSELDVDGAKTLYATATEDGLAESAHSNEITFILDTTGSEDNDTYTITASAGSHGSISPSGSITVNQGSDKSFTITPDTGYQIDDVLVDGSSVGVVSSYTFTNVNQNHTIYATFIIEDNDTYTITASAGSHGSISPSGSVTVNEGSDKSFTITPDTGYQTDDVLVDGSSVGAVSSYTFTNVTQDHTLYATFIIEENGTYDLRDIGPAGGYIFYDKGYYSSGWRYLEAAPASAEWTTKQWGSHEIFIGGTEAGIGTGQSNTTIIVTWLNNHSETDRAAQLCDALVYGGYSDWFLPSRMELNLIYENLHLFGVGGFADDYYWSSSEYSANLAYLQAFSNGGYGNFYKYGTHRVRAVRAF